MMNKKLSMVFVVGKERDKLGTRSNEHGFEKRVYYGIENDEGYLAAVMVFAGDEKRVWKSSPNHCRKFAGTQAIDEELRRGVKEATSGGSR
jgi:hypothetical protein